MPSAVNDVIDNMDDTVKMTLMRELGLNCSSRTSMITSQLFITPSPQPIVIQETSILTNELARELNG